MFFKYGRQDLASSLSYADLVYVCARDSAKIKEELTSIENGRYQYVTTTFWDVTGRVCSYEDPNYAHMIASYQQDPSLRVTSNGLYVIERAARPQEAQQSRSPNYAVSPGYKLTILKEKNTQSYYVVLSTDWVDLNRQPPCLPEMHDLLCNTLLYERQKQDNKKPILPSILLLAHGLGGHLAMSLTLKLHEKKQSIETLQCITFDAVGLLEYPEESLYHLNPMSTFRHIVSKPNVMNITGHVLGEKIYVSLTTTEQNTPKYASYANDYCYFIASRAAHNLWVLALLRVLKDPIHSLHIKNRSTHESKLRECFILEEDICAQTKENFNKLYGDKLSNAVRQIESDMVLRSQNMAALHYLRDQSHALSRFRELKDAAGLMTISALAHNAYSLPYLLGLREDIPRFLISFKDDLLKDTINMMISTTPNTRYNDYLALFDQVSSSRTKLPWREMTEYPCNPEQRAYAYGFLRCLWIAYSIHSVTNQAHTEYKLYARLLSCVIPESADAIQDIVRLLLLTKVNAPTYFDSSQTCLNFVAAMIERYQHVLALDSELGATKLARIHFKKYVRILSAHLDVHSPITQNDVMPWIRQHFDLAGDYHTTICAVSYDPKKTGTAALSSPEHPVSPVRFSKTVDSLPLGPKPVCLSTQVISEMSRDVRPKHAELAKGQPDAYRDQIAYRTELDNALSGEVSDSINFATMRHNSVRVFIWSLSFNESFLERFLCGFFSPCIQAGGHTAMSIKGQDEAGNLRFEHISLYSGSAIHPKDHAHYQWTRPCFLSSYASSVIPMLDDNTKNRLARYHWDARGDADCFGGEADFVIDIVFKPEEIKAMFGTYDRIRSQPDTLYYTPVPILAWRGGYNCNSLSYKILSQGQYQTKLGVTPAQSFFFDLGKKLNEGLTLGIVVLFACWLYDAKTKDDTQEENSLSSVWVAALRTGIALSLSLVWVCAQRFLKSVQLSIEPASLQHELLKAASRITAPDIQLVHTRESLQSTHYLDQSFSL